MLLQIEKSVLSSYYSCARLSNCIRTWRENMKAIYSVTCFHSSHWDLIATTYTHGFVKNFRWEPWLYENHHKICTTSNLSKFSAQSRTLSEHSLRLRLYAAQSLQFQSNKWLQFNQECPSVSIKGSLLMHTVILIILLMAQ